MYFTRKHMTLILNNFFDNFLFAFRNDRPDNLCSIQTKGIQHAQNGNLQAFPLATARLDIVFISYKSLLVHCIHVLLCFERITSFNK
jgi:hypothetical protein